MCVDRHDLIDCEYESNDKEIKKHRRNPLRYDWSDTCEFKILATYKDTEDDVGQPDTYYVSVQDLPENYH